MRPSRPKMQPSHFWPEKIRAQAEGDFYSHKLIVSLLIILNSIPREFAFRPQDRRRDGRAVSRRAARVAPFPRGVFRSKKRGPMLHRRASGCPRVVVRDRTATRTRAASTPVTT